MKIWNEKGKSLVNIDYKYRKFQKGNFKKKKLNQNKIYFCLVITTKIQKNK